MKAAFLLFLLPLLVLGDYASVFKDNTTNAFSTIPGAAGVAAFGWADYNKDGHQDLVASGKSGSTCYFTLQKNNGTVMTDVAAAAGLDATVAATTVLWADYNQDGWMDLLVYGSTCAPALSVKLYKNNQGAFVNAPLPTLPAGVDGGTAAFVDFDSDSWLDIVFTTAQPAALIFLRNKGDGTFADVSSTWGTGVGALTQGSLAFSDYNRDGKVDLFITGVVSGAATLSAAVYKNTGTGFTDATTAVLSTLLPATKSSTMKFLDFNRDSFEDFVFIGIDGSSVAHTYLFVNNKNGTFSDASSLITGNVALYGGAIAVGDYNGDRFPDFYVQGAAANAKLFRNELGKTFSDATAEAFPLSILTGVSGGAAVFGDFDGDGLADDLVMAGTNAGSTDVAPKLYISNALPIRRPLKLFPLTVTVTGTGSKRSVVVKTSLRADVHEPIDSIEVVVTPNGGKVTKIVPPYNSKDTYKFTASVDNIPVLSTLRKVWVRAVNKVGKGEWAVSQVTI